MPRRNRTTSPPRERKTPHSANPRTSASKMALPLRDQAALLQLTHDSIIVRDLDERIIFWNRGAEQRYGWSAAQAIGQISHVLLKTEFPQPLDEILSQLLRDGTWEGELVHTSRDGKRITVDSRRALQFDAHGKPAAILEINNDTTARKQAEAELRQLQAELEQRVRERTAQLEAANRQQEDLNIQLEKEIGERQRAEQEVRQLYESLEQRARDLDRANEELETANEELRLTNEELRVTNEELGVSMAERQRAEEGLVESERKFSLLFQKAGFSAALSRMPDGVLVDVNEAWTRFFGYTAQEAVGKTTFDLHINPDAQVRARILAELNAKGTVRDLEMTLWTKSGEPRTLLTNVDVLDLSGQKYILNTAQDITERRRAEQALRESEERFKSIAETTPIGVGVIGLPDNNFLFANAAYSKAFGYAPSELLNHKAPDVYWDIADRDHLVRLLRDNGQISDCEVRLKRKDGTLFWGIVTARPISFGGRPALLGAFVDITERKQAENRLRDQARILEAISDAVVVSDLSFRITSWNTSAERIYGWKEQEVLGKAAADVLRSEMSKEQRAAIYSALQSGVPVPTELVQWTCDGRRLIIEGYSIPLRDMAGNITGYVAVNRDITGRKRAEELMLYQAALVNNASDAIISSDENFTIRTWNPAAEALYGWRAEEVIGKRSSEVLVADVKGDQDRQAAARDFVEKGFWRGEIVYQRRDGKTVDVFVSSVALRDSRGKINGALAIHTNNTERKRGEAALQKAIQALEASETKYRDLVQNANSIVLQMGRDGRVNFINEYGCKLFGYSPDELIGKDVRILLPAVENESGRDLEEMADQVLKNPDSFAENVNENICKNGERLWISWRNRSVQDSQGNLIGNLAIGQDVTARKRAEEQIRQLNKDLALRAESLNVANQELEAFAISIAHDLRAPALSIRNVVTMLHDDYGAQLSPETRPLFKLLRANTEEMEQLIEGLLRIAQVARQPVKKQRVATGEIVRAALQELEPERAGRAIEITMGDLPDCDADPMLLKQVWIQLLSNAIKFTRPRPMAHIEIGSAGVGTDTSETPVFFVKDDGVGFATEYAERIFRAFQRYHHTDEYEGSGIGLAMVESIIRRHGGRVWAQGKVDQGAMFFFTLENAAS